MSTNVANEWASLDRLTAEAHRLNKSIVFDALSTAGITLSRSDSTVKAITARWNEPWLKPTRMRSSFLP